MHLMALGAFWPIIVWVSGAYPATWVLMYLMALGAFWRFKYYMWNDTSGS